MLIYPAQLSEQLDFAILLRELEKFCYGKNSKKQALELQPTANQLAIEGMLNETSEYLLSLHQDHSVPLQGYAEVDKELHLLSVQNSVLSAQQVHLLRQMLHASYDVLLFFKEKDEIFPALCARCAGLERNNDFLEFINEIIDKEGIVKDDASPGLRKIRKDLQDNRRDSDRLYRVHIQRLKKAGHLADFEESYVNGRRVLGILAEHKREFKGIMMGQSSSGKIAFMEPSNVIELNNEKLQLEEEERKEIYRILKQLTDELRPHHSFLLQHYQLLTNMDFISAKAKLGKLMQATLPRIVRGQASMTLVNAFHPVLLLQNQAQQRPTVPIHCSFTPEQHIMVISGPNAGGKSITLKTIGLLQIMIQCGLLIPASARSEISIKNKLFGDIGDNQSIEDGLSTYSSRLIKMNYFLKHTDEHTLFLIDEFGTGSDPDMGGALAEVILDRLHEKKAQGVVTTHFTNLKLLANTNAGIFNACMLFNSKTLKPLYQLHIGEPGSSFTFEVAEKIGLPEELISAAKQKLSSEKVAMDRLLNQLQAEKNVMSKLKRDLQKQMSKTTAEKREFQELTDQLEESLEKNRANKEERQKLIDYGKKLHQLTQEWGQTKDKKGVIGKFVKLAGYEQALRKEQEAIEKSDAFRQQKIDRIKSLLVVGSKVKMMKSRETGIVQSIRGERAQVLFGRVAMNVGLEKLEPA